MQKITLELILLSKCKQLSEGILSWSDVLWRKSSLSTYSSTQWHTNVLINQIVEDIFSFVFSSTWYLGTIFCTTLLSQPIQCTQSHIKIKLLNKLLVFLLGQHDIIFDDILDNFTILLCMETVSILQKTWNTPWTRLLSTRKPYLLESPFWASGFFWNTRWNIWKISTAQSCKNLF